RAGGADRRSLEPHQNARRRPLRAEAVHGQGVWTGTRRRPEPPAYGASERSADAGTYRRRGRGGGPLRGTEENSAGGGGALCAGDETRGCFQSERPAARFT